MHSQTVSQLQLLLTELNQSLRSAVQGAAEHRELGSQCEVWRPTQARNAQCVVRTTTTTTVGKIFLKNWKYFSTVWWEHPAGLLMLVCWCWLEQDWVAAESGPSEPPPQWLTDWLTDCYTAPTTSTTPAAALRCTELRHSTLLHSTDTTRNTKKISTA